MKEFKIRASAIGSIMTNSRDRISMGDTAKTYCEEWLKEQIYGRRKKIENKYMDKGIIAEDEAIEFVSVYFPDLPLLIKNEQFFENKYMTGTPDLILPDEIIDVKCSWCAFTFPLFKKELPEKDYYWQMQGYMDLVCVKKARVIYVLVDTPMELVEREIRFNPDKEDEIIAYHSYSTIPDNYRIKCFDVYHDPAAIEAIKTRVGECRNYLKTL